VHAAVDGDLDAWITALPVDGYLGDALDTPTGQKKMKSLAKFAKALSDAMIELAADDPESGLTAKERKKVRKSGVKEKKKEGIFDEWRDNEFEVAVADATKRGVRYAGMGEAHLDNLVTIGLTAGQHPFYMGTTDLTKFKNETAKLASTAVPP
jgi:hypothetical protein